MKIIYFLDKKENGYPFINWGVVEKENGFYTLVTLYDNPYHRKINGIDSKDFKYRIKKLPKNWELQTHLLKIDVVYDWITDENSKYAHSLQKEDIIKGIETGAFVPKSENDYSIFKEKIYEDGTYAIVKETPIVSYKKNIETSKCINTFEEILEIYNKYIENLKKYSNMDDEEFWMNYYKNKLIKWKSYAEPTKDDFDKAMSFLENNLSKITDYSGTQTTFVFHTEEFDFKF